jgi:hypothetical protein
MGHAQACQKQDDRDQWMQLAHDENLSVAELRRRIRGDVEVKVKVRKWSMEELRASADDYTSRPYETNPHAFLDYLEAL